MDNEKLHNELLQKLKKEGAFWSYKNFDIQKLEDEILISKVLEHLDIEDIKILFQLYPKRKIQNVWKESMLSQPMYYGLNRLYSFLFFDIKNPDRYIRYYTNKRYKTLICKD